MKSFIGFVREKLNRGRFVVQDHEATNRHLDLRLERDGVYRSWAIPKGFPTSTKERRMAVQTQDHDLKWGSFTGEIPKGEYGAGKVTVYDKGRYSIEKWTDDEILFELKGKKLTGRFFLIKTKKNWILGKAKQQ